MFGPSCTYGRVIWRTARTSGRVLGDSSGARVLRRCQFAQGLLLLRGGHWSRLVQLGGPATADEVLGQGLQHEEAEPGGHLDGDLLARLHAVAAEVSERLVQLLHLGLRDYAEVVSPVDQGR